MKFNKTCVYVCRNYITMFGKLTACLLLAVVLVNLGHVSCSPAIASIFDPEPVEICIRDCAQCYKMLGSEWFDGARCAKACIRQGGRFAIPFDCENYAAIAPFLIKQN